MMLNCTKNRSPTSPLGEFKREGFGRQSMSEKRKGHIDPSRSEVYQRVKSSRQRGMFSILLQSMLILLISKYFYGCKITFTYSCLDKFTFRTFKYDNKMISLVAFDLMVQCSRNWIMSPNIVILVWVTMTLIDHWFIHMLLIFDWLIHM